MADIDDIDFGLRLSRALTNRPVKSVSSEVGSMNLGLNQRLRQLV